MSNQLDFINDFEAADKERAVADRQREVTHEIIDQSPADPRVKALLHVLVDLPKPTKDERGNWLVTVSIKTTLVSRLARSRNCVRSYIKLARSTPYLGVLDDCDDDKRTYVIFWRSILDRETTTTEPNKRIGTATTEDVETTNKRTGVATTEDGHTGSIATSGGGQFPHGGGSIPNPGGVNLATPGGQLTGVKSPQTPTKTLENVFYLDKSKKRLQECLGGGQSHPSGFWPRWDSAIATRDLTNPQHVHELCVIAVELGIVSAADPLARPRIFAQAALSERLWRNGKAKGARKALFASNVANRRWWCSCADEDSGRESLKRADRYVRCDDPVKEKERLSALLKDRIASDREKSLASVSPGG